MSRKAAGLEASLPPSPRGGWLACHRRLDVVVLSSCRGWGKRGEPNDFRRPRQVSPQPKSLPSPTDCTVCGRSQCEVTTSDMPRSCCFDWDGHIRYLRLTKFRDPKIHKSFLLAIRLTYECALASVAAVHGSRYPVLLAMDVVAYLWHSPPAPRDGRGKGTSRKDLYPWFLPIFGDQRLNGGIRIPVTPWS